MPRWGMVVDLRRCIGCATCKETCTQFNEQPRGAQWRKVIENGNGVDGRRLFVSMGCMHCERPSCLDVCPTGATRKRSDGIVAIDTQRCIGCGACVLACPYRARSITIDQRIERGGHSDTPAVPIGVCTKCDFCANRIESARSNDLRPGVDEDATPICVWSCIADAISFGDLDDPESNVSELLRNNPHIQMNHSCGNDPAVYYIPLDCPDSEPR